MNLINDNEAENEEEGDIMGANVAMPRRRLDLNKLSSRFVESISTEESLQDITPIEWSDDVVLGNKKVEITKEGILEE